jgi:hypothetical protein
MLTGLYFYKILGRSCIEMCISSYMKRLNPTTKEPFKRGDVREDGYVFFNYTTKLKSDGYFMERWLSAAASEKAKQKDKDKKREKYERKTDRKSPGFRSLTAAQMRTVHQLQRINSEGDWTDDEIVGELIGYEIDSGPLLDEAIYHSGKLYFNAKELFRRALEL